MGAVDIVVGPAAVRDIKKLTKDGQRAVVKALDALKLDPRPEGVEKIQGHPRYYRLKVSDFRVIYCPLSAKRVVVLLVGDRKEAYRNVKGLDDKMEAASATLKRSAKG